MLREFEYLLITAADNAYGAAVREEIEAAIGRKCSIGALYTTIDRLETKGLLKTWMGAITLLLCDRLSNWKVALWKLRSKLASNWNRATR
jgi:hypothetical protein